MVKDSKIRVMMTLDRDLMTQFRADLDELNLPAQHISLLVNEWMTSFAPILHKLAEKKRKGEQLSFDEVMGEVLEGMGKAMKS